MSTSISLTFKSVEWYLMLLSAICQTRRFSSLLALILDIPLFANVWVVANIKEKSVTATEKRLTFTHSHHNFLIWQFLFSYCSPYTPGLVCVYCGGVTLFSYQAQLQDIWHIFWHITYSLEALSHSPKALCRRLWPKKFVLSAL